MTQVKRAKGWPLSHDELKAAKAVVAPTISFVAVAEKYSKGIEEVGSASFTHRCICPNPKHKNGQERTPSFYFSEEDKSFRCFGCSLNGDVFDLLALLKGMPWTEVVRHLIDRKNIDIDQVDLNVEAIKTETLQQYIFDVNLKISTVLRQHLEEYVDTESYEDEKKWIDTVFKKIDSRLEKLENGNKEAVKELELHILMDLERRRARKSR